MPGRKRCLARVSRRVADVLCEREGGILHTGVAISSLTAKQGVAMLRALVLIGTLLFLRAVLPHKPRWSATATSPYMNALDGMLSAQQVSSVLDEITPYDGWLQAHRGSDPDQVRNSLPHPLKTKGEECVLTGLFHQAPPEP